MNLVIYIIFLVILSACAGFQSRYHRVQSGESVEAIAIRYRVPVSEIQKYNSVALSRGLKAGTKLYIPFEERPDWYGRQLDAESSSRGPAEDRVHFSWPLVGYVSSGFGRRQGRDHDGIDIPSRAGTSVRASRSGHVIYAGNRIKGYGNMVIVRHADKFSTVYAHLSKLEVKRGQFVSRGHRIGRVGRTGRATSPHLHFEIRDKSVAVNPLLYLQGQYAHNILPR